MAFKLVAVVVVVLFLVQIFPSSEHLVQVNCRSSSNSCRTFNDYANSVDTYFISDTSFHFVKGTHHLNRTIIVTDVVNLRFHGDDSNIILSNGCSIIWNASSNISWISLNLIFNETNVRTNNSAVLFENSQVVTFSNTSFLRLHHRYIYYSRAVSAMSSSIVFESCKFENGHHSKGGIIHIEDCNVTFSGHNDFLNNTANYSAGALYGWNSQIHMDGSGTFEGNKAGLGYEGNTDCDGTAIHVEHSNISFYGQYKFNNNLFVEKALYLNCSGTISTRHSSLTLQGLIYFINNSNINGAAISLRYSDSLISGHIEFAGNKAVNYGGAIEAIQSSLITQANEFYDSTDSFSTHYPQTTLFFNNSAEWGGAINLWESNLTLTGSVIFTENKASGGGGGISVFHTSTSIRCNPKFIIFQEPLDLQFHSNVAKGVGGALYVCDAFISCRQLVKNDSFNCFFTVNGSKNFVNMSFSDNVALEGGTSIHGGAIQYCQVELGHVNWLGYQVIQKLTKKYSTEIINEYASHNVREIDFCNGTSDNIRVQRGQVFNISVTMLGEFNFPVNESVTLNQPSSSTIIGQPFNNLKMKGCRNLGFSILSEDQIVQLTLHPSQCFYDRVSLKMTVHLEDCPPGFELFVNYCKCHEQLLDITHDEDLCNSSTGLIKCPQHDWMKPILDENLTYQGFMWSPNCPAHLCRNDEDNWLDFSSDNVDFLCLENRTALLCGACLQNYSLTLSSLKCSKCSNNYSSLLLVFPLAGVVLIASLLLLHMTVADGTINGLIFYANMINIIKDILFLQDKLPPNPLPIFLSWLNLDFGIPVCFYRGLNYYSYTWLQFIFPFYLWFLVALIILACKYSSRAMKLFGSNPVAVLATVVLMSYSKLLHTSQQILSYVTVYYSNGTQEKRWKIDPNLLYFQGKHIPLAMFGLFVVIVFLLPYIVLLSFGHCLQKYSNKRGLKWLAKIKPILDAYYAPFYKNTRYWVGFLIFIRTCLSITCPALRNTEHIAILGGVSSVLTGIALIPWMQQKIYLKNCANILEGSFILNIIILITVSIVTSTTKKKSKNQLIIFYTSIGIAFIEFLAILAFHAWHRLNIEWLYMKYIKNENAAVLSKSKDVEKLRGNVATTMTFDIREPLLDDSTEL